MLTVLHRDEFLVIKDEGLLPLEHAEPAAYEGVQPNRLGRDSTFDDVCKFFVEYMQSDLVVCRLHGPSGCVSSNASHRESSQTGIWSLLVRSRSYYHVVPP